MMEGVRLQRRVGLEGADVAKRGWWKLVMEPLESNSQWAFSLGLLDVGEDRGGVTGALLEIRRGGRDEGIAARL